MNELRELKEHIRWLEDERHDATAIDGCLDQIDERLERIEEALERHANTLNRLIDALNRVGDCVNSHSNGLQKLVDVLANPKPAPTMSDVFSAIFQPGEPTKPAAKPKPRKTKLSVVSKDDGEGPGGA